MAADEDYASFLEKANQDTGSKRASTQSKTVRARAVDTEIPPSLLDVEEYYVSDADEPFEPVSLKWDGDGLPSSDELARLIGYDGDFATISQKEFDPQGQYTTVVDAVKQAGGGDVAFFRAEHGTTRVEYYIIGLDKKGGKIVGLKALAVES
ncbi:hypothetical protein W97_03968 [Coniosporium apollinis CBS 100218]|uniref:Uncharacterized protein n=1 Tax=Coniosporium apollinis (strain CBS 100218) TaxID=1168221 RepID=R7YS52_CONA1|nr:uncharacterized protein W97_03968 [Coniosporium apollinis CBS 100218]EON64735.1 hypothetical protein W97_03968 [Coniosporium apollinis CBS 100218]